MDATPGLKTYAEMVDARMEELLPSLSEEPIKLHEAMRYSALAPGKRLRPALLLECSRVVGGDVSLHIDTACAVEFVHVFSLIHDDLPALDNDDLRRGQPTCHIKFGENIAIMAGDALFATAFTLIKDGRAVRELARASVSLVRGETMDLMSEGMSADAEKLEFIHQNKTVALVSASCAIGAWLGGGSGPQVEALRQYGQHVGLAFQIADDLLNETSTPEQLGKAAGSDRERKKLTYPALYGVDESRRMAEEQVSQAIGLLADFEDSGKLIDWAQFALQRKL
ncbi:MAG: polyprenyl synthetase family protein [Chthonomonas sp.]|nr:polyprenyl synthetase family protein [Chthonomonas sp.]